MGHVDVVRFLHENHLGGSCGEMTMQYAALAGHLDVMRFLYENRPESKCRVDDLMEAAADVASALAVLAEGLRRVQRWDLSDWV
jgi:hypothetical protein